MANFNWAAAFVAFCNNHPVSEIAEAFGIPLQTLENRIRSEKWGGLRTELPLATNASIVIAPSVAGPVGTTDPFEQGKQPTPAPDAGQGAIVPADQKLPVAIQAKIFELAKNRKINFTDADKLRQAMQKIVDQMLTPEGLVVEQLYHYKGSVVRTTRTPTTGDLVNIATFMRQIQDMTYKALGDTTVQDKPGQDSPAGANGTVTPAIIINLPGAIAQPRKNRQLIKDAKKAGAKIIDVDGVIEGQKLVEGDGLTQGADPLQGGEDYTSSQGSGEDQ